MNYEEIVDQIVDEIEKVKHVKNYYEVDPDGDYVKVQFEIVMQDDTVWEVEFRRGQGFWWRGNVYPWRIIQNNKGGFTQIAFSIGMLKSYMKKVKAIQNDEVNEATEEQIQARLERKLKRSHENRKKFDQNIKIRNERDLCKAVEKIFEEQISDVMDTSYGIRGGMKHIWCFSKEGSLTYNCDISEDFKIVKLNLSYFNKSLWDSEMYNTSLYTKTLSYDEFVNNDVSQYFNKMKEIAKKYSGKFARFKTLFAKTVDEDFSMGVGAPCGLDQGIPHSGDCKGVAMVKWGQSAPTGVKAAHYPQYWLNQLPKKKKKKKKKVFKESCYDYLTTENQFLDENLNEADILSRAKEVLTRFKDSITTAIRRQDSTEAEATQDDIEQFKKEVKNSDKFTTSKTTILGAIAILLMASNMAVAGDFHQADRYMHRLNHTYTSQEVIPSRTVYHDGPDRRDVRFQDDDPTNDYVDPRDYRPPHDRRIAPPPRHHHHHNHGKTTTISIGKGGLKIHTDYDR